MLYALARRGAIELVVNETGGDPTRVAQAERARVETDRWLERESLDRRRDAGRAGAAGGAVGLVARARRSPTRMWRKEAMGVLLWALQHLDAMPAFGERVRPGGLDGAVTRYGSVDSFRANGLLRPDEQVEQAWLEADAWFGATEGRTGDDASMASIAAERFRALSWLRDAASAPA